MFGEHHLFEWYRNINSGKLYNHLNIFTSWKLYETISTKLVGVFVYISLTLFQNRTVYNIHTCNKLCKIWAFFQTQHKPHLGLPRTWIISPKAMLKDPPSWDFRGRATTCHECTVFVKECFVLMAFPLKDMNSIVITVKPPTSSNNLIHIVSFSLYILMRL